MIAFCRTAAIIGHLRALLIRCKGIKNILFTSFLPVEAWREQGSAQSGFVFSLMTLITRKAVPMKEIGESAFSKPLMSKRLLQPILRDTLI